MMNRLRLMFILMFLSTFGGWLRSYRHFGVADTLPGVFISMCNKRLTELS